MEEIKLPDNNTFNHVAARENIANKKHVTLTHGGGITTLSIGRKVTYKGIPAPLLSVYEKKKLENIILFMFLPELKQMPVITYA
jgi:hypothetical protein